MKKIIKIEGMSCKHCVSHVTSALEKIDGVMAVEVNLKGKEACIELSKEVSDEVLIEAIEECGFEVK